jgi:hypothetical protein
MSIPNCPSLKPSFVRDIVLLAKIVFFVLR